MLAPDSQHRYSTHIALYSNCWYDPKVFLLNTPSATCIPSKNCDSAYVGQKRRLFVVKLKEHQRALFTGDSEKSTLAEHA